MKIKTDDGAIGRSLKTTATKSDDSEDTVCEIKAQLSVKRTEIDSLAGFPPGFAATFYTEDGAPIANMEIRLPKRELQVSGKLWRGDDEHAAELPLKKATADALRFKLEPNGAVLICRLSWRAAGDEVEEVKDLLGKWCSVELTFTDPLSKQAKLQLQGGGKPEGDAHTQTEIPPATDTAAGPAHGVDAGETTVDAGAPGSSETAPPALAARLAALGIQVPDSDRFWFTVSPGELQRVIKFCDRREAGESANLPSVLKAFKSKAH